MRTKWRLKLRFSIGMVLGHNCQNWEECRLLKRKRNNRDRLSREKLTRHLMLSLARLYLRCRLLCKLARRTRSSSIRMPLREVWTSVNLKVVTISKSILRTHRSLEPGPGKVKRLGVARQPDAARRIGSCRQFRAMCLLYHGTHRQPLTTSKTSCVPFRGPSTSSRSGSGK